MLKKKVLSCAVVLGIFTTQIAPIVIQAQESVVDEVSQVEVPVESEPEVSESVSESVSETTPEPSPEPEQPEQPVVEESSDESSDESSSEEELEIEEDEDTVAFEDIEWITVEIVTEINLETGEALETVEIQIPDVDKYFAISKGKRSPVVLTEDQRTAVYNYVADNANTDLGFYYINEHGAVLILPEYAHTLYTKEEFEVYKSEQLSKGYNYDASTDTFHSIPTVDVSYPMQNTESGVVQLNAYPVTELGYYQESQAEAFTDEELAPILGYRQIVRADLATGENVSGTLYNGKEYSLLGAEDYAVLTVDGGEYNIPFDEQGRGQLDIDDSSDTDASRTLLVVTSGEGYANSELEFGSKFYIVNEIYGDSQDDYGTFSSIIIPDEELPEESTPEESTPEESTPEESTPDESTPGESTPDESTPEESTPEESQPVVETKTETEVVEIDFKIVTVKDGTLLEGQTQVSVEGVKGEKTITYENYYVDGELVNSIKIKEEITKPEVNKVVRVGTGVQQAPTQPGGATGNQGQYPEGTPLDKDGKPVITYADRGPKNHLYSEELHKDLTCDELFELGMYNFQNTDLGYTKERDTLNKGIGCPYGVESADDVVLEDTGIDNPIIAIIGVIAGIGLGGFFLLKGRRGAKEGGNVGE